MSRARKVAEAEWHARGGRFATSVEELLSPVGNAGDSWWEIAFRWACSASRMKSSPATRKVLTMNHYARSLASLAVFALVAGCKSSNPEPANQPGDMQGAMPAA